MGCLRGSEGCDEPDVQQADDLLVPGNDCFEPLGSLLGPPEKSGFRRTKIDRWEQNRRQAINRIKIGRKLSERTLERFDIGPRDVQEALKQVNARKKWEYDRRAHRRRALRGEPISERVARTYELHDLIHVKPERPKRLGEIFRRVRSSRPSRPPSKYDECVCVWAVKKKRGARPVDRDGEKGR